MRRFAATLVLAGASGLGLAPEAAAKLCVGIEAPRTAHTGTAITVRVRTFQPTWDGTRIVDREPARATFRLRLVLRGPDGSYREVVLRRTRSSAVWSTKVRLGRPGTWTLSVSGWESAPRACAPSVRLRVRR